ncbi:hypothetical protein [Pseudoxanthomonas sp. JBR18]|uniref:XAC0095 family protein n=1 Tax=Pseudoxanthomonas sp. JBR18 TaxID=2969308 RepID=UPI00230589DD|nr:hypothetical protein [Pseudoxanthomonas sp. JBR18]WCE05834.1 hypothetical protein PJ250_07765 [Pseudoxanthomonas sp. JBR18]
MAGGHFMVKGEAAMTEQTFDDQDAGDFLRENSGLLLKQVRNHIHFLARLAQSNAMGGTQDVAPDVGMAEVLSCLDQLSEQLDLLLKDVTAYGRRGHPQMADLADVIAAHSDASGEDEEDDEEEASSPDHPGDEERDDVPASPARHDTYAQRLVFGVTLAQIDTLQQLIAGIKAYADAVFADGMADFAPGTLATLGSTIFDRANDVSEILREINAQSLQQGRAGFAVEETAPAYLVQGRAGRSHLSRGTQAWEMPVTPVARHTDPLHLH